jgi:hypothetical protein
MATFFLNNSGFRPLHATPPQCFLDLEPLLAPRAHALAHPELDPAIALAANLCRRLADVLVSAGDVVAIFDKPRDGRQFTIGTRLVGFYSACQTLLDAGAITLTHQYGLQTKQGTPLTPKQQDFGKGDIWNALHCQQPSVEKRYRRFKKMIAEIGEWRDAAVHRVTPLVVTTMGRDPESNGVWFVRYSMALDPKASLQSLLDLTADTTVPTYHFDRWRLDLLEFCKEVCEDIKTTV